MTGTKLRVSEVYLSIQGEGPRVGSPTVFVRFAGCNLRCPNWACDTPHAIDPTLYRLDAKLLTVEEIVQQVEDVAPHGADICYTGGEPFLQNHDSFQQLVIALAKKGYLTQEAFTNGTLRYPDWAYDELLLVLDWKLTGAGEDFSPGANSWHDTRMKNLEGLSEGDVVKFTIADGNDYDEAKNWYNILGSANPEVDFIYGVVWGKLEAKDLIEWVLRDGLVEWTYSHQLHNVIWDRSERGI